MRPKSRPIDREKLPKERKPAWLKVRAPSGENFAKIKQLRRSKGLATVCEEANCPNLGECWGGGTATFMVMGDTCTRGCKFCNVKSGNPQGALDIFEPKKLADAVENMGLSYVVLTMVDRDDLEDGGAEHVERCVETTLDRCPDLKVEVLMGDFRGLKPSLQRIAHGRTHVLAHNVETVERLTPTVRDRRSGYRQSLEALQYLKSEAKDKLTKSSIMLGLGETDEEVDQTLVDLREHDVDIVTLGQYLQPSARHLAVEEYVPPAVFDRWRERAEELGFLFCASGPLVRSSYKAGELFAERWLRERDRASASS